MRLKIVLILGAIAILASVAAGCGGGSDSTSGSTASNETTRSEGDTKTTKSEGSPDSKRLTKSEFTTLVNETCIQVPPTYEEKRKKLEKGRKAPTKAEINRKAAVPPLYIALEELESLNPPASEEGTLEEVISAMEAAAKGLEAKPNSELSGPKSPFAEFQKVTKEKGFETCAGL
jgi:hypothetical protein